MDLLKPGLAIQRLARLDAENLLDILTVPDLVRRNVPIECHDATGPKRALKPVFPFQDGALVKPPLAEKRGKNQRAERGGQNGRLSGQDTFFDGQTCVAKNADRKYCRPDDRDGEHEGRYCREGRPEASSNPD